MSVGLLADHIGPLVDKLRQGQHEAVSLPDVAALTEVLMRSLESYFQSIDLTLYQECQSLADFMDDARKEIASLSPEHANSAEIPRAGQELQAIVEQTEKATNTIMESAETIMSADTDDADAFQATVNDAVMQIFEACSFQDITGQRISKVVRTLEHVEDRVDRLINILGVNVDDIEAPEEEVDENQSLLNGPALEGEGIDQSEIDALLGKDTAQADDDIVLEDDEPEAAAEESAPEPVEESAVAEEVIEGEAAPEPSEEPEVELPEDAGQDDIDALFDEAPAAEAEEEVVAEEPAPEATPEPEPVPEPVAEKKPVELAEKKAAKKPKPVAYEADAEAALDAKESETTSQADIDALFG